jgi:hypothetical protein
MSPDGDTPRMTGTDIRQGRQFGREATYDMDMHFAFCLLLALSRVMVHCRPIERLLKELRKCDRTFSRMRVDMTFPMPMSHLETKRGTGFTRI